MVEKITIEKIMIYKNQFILEKSINFDGYYGKSRYFK